MGETVIFRCRRNSVRAERMDWGLQNRLSRIIKPETGRTVMLAVDHGYFMGPTHKLEEPRKTIEPLLPYSDAIMCTRGVLRTSVNPKSHVPIVLRVSGGASVVGESLTNETTTTSFKIGRASCREREYIV